MNRELVVRKANTIRDLLEEPKYRKPLEAAIPKHLTVDRLLRTVMTAIRTNPKLLDCTRESLLAAVMACAQLGLEPEPFLGQAYLVPFKNQVVFIPGYRGYIALARRSGEVQSVSSQVVYENDHFRLQYGTDERLEHMPTDGDRGNPKGAYVIFKYKDGGHSFDYMTTADIEKIRQNFSKQPDGLMWKENWAEGAKKTVIRRHVKLVPLAVEIQKAAALEDRAYGGESQFDMIFPEPEGKPQINGGSLEEWQNLLAAKCGAEGVPESFPKYIKVTAEANEMTEEQLKISACRRFDAFWDQYQTWIKWEAEKGEGEAPLPFKGLKSTGLKKWEEENRDKIPTMPDPVKKAFFAKWQKLMGEAYIEKVEPKEEDPSGTQQQGELKVPEYEAPKDLKDAPEDEFVECPLTNEQMKKSYCENQCKHRNGCPEYEQ